MTPRLRRHIRPNSGQTLVEVVIAVGIVVVILVALISGTTKSLRTVRFSRDKALSTQYAQEGLEAVRSIRDRGYALIETNGAYGLQWNGSQWNFSGSSEAIDNFTRTVTIADGPGADTKTVAVTISWPEGDGIETTTITTVLARLN